MPPLAKIKTKQISLDELIKTSVTLNALPEAERRKAIVRIKALPKEEQKKVAEVLLKERTKVEETQEHATTEKQKIIQDYFVQLKGTEKKILRKAHQMAETAERESETEKGKTLLEEIHKTEDL